jgi:hypothetical protein
MRFNHIVRTCVVAPFGELEFVVEQQIFNGVEHLFAITVSLNFNKSNIKEGDLFGFIRWTDLVELLSQVSSN